MKPLLLPLLIGSLSLSFINGGEYELMFANNTALHPYAHSNLEWIIDDYESALAEAKETETPIFIDFTGYTCTNCRWMEQHMFAREDISEGLHYYVLARLYTDKRDEVSRKNRQLLLDRFNTIDLSFYALMSPQDSIIATQTFTRDAEEFKEFLAKGITD